MSGPHRIVVVGDLVLDVFVTDDCGASARDASGAVRISPGGSAANFAVNAARAGARVSFFGRVGDDASGRLLLAELERDGVATRVRLAPGVATGHVLVAVAADGSSRMVSDPGASALLAPDDLDPREIAGADLVHVTGYSWLREGAAAAARAAVRHARAGGALVSLDPGPAHLIAQYGRAILLRDLVEDRVDLLFPNLDEGVAMTAEDEPRAIVAALRRVAPLVVLKLGHAGCLVAWSDGGDRCELVPASPANVVDTTGAGDAFAAGFAVEYLRARDPLAAVRAGAEAAARTIGRVGAR